MIPDIGTCVHYCEDGTPYPAIVQAIIDPVTYRVRMLQLPCGTEREADYSAVLANGFWTEVPPFSPP